MNSCCHPLNSACLNCSLRNSAFLRASAVILFGGLFHRRGAENAERRRDKEQSTKLFQSTLPLRSRHVVVFRRLTAVDSITFADLLYVLTSFTIWGNVASVFHDRAFSGIITREHQIHATPEHGHQLLQITGAAHDVLGRIVWPTNTQPARCSGHQLHQSLGAFWAASELLKPRFLLDNTKDQVGINPEPGGIRLY